MSAWKTTRDPRQCKNSATPAKGVKAASTRKRFRKSVIAAATVVSIAGAAFGGAAAANAATGDTATIINPDLPAQLSNGTIGYCLDFNKHLASVGDVYVESPWGSYAGATTQWNTDPTVRGKVLWILAHSAPALTPAEISAETGG